MVRMDIFVSDLFPFFLPGDSSDRSSISDSSNIQTQAQSEKEDEEKKIRNQSYSTTKRATLQKEFCVNELDDKMWLLHEEEEEK